MKYFDIQRNWLERIILPIYHRLRAWLGLCPYCLTWVGINNSEVLCVPCFMRMMQALTRLYVEPAEELCKSFVRCGESAGVLTETMQGLTVRLSDDD